MKEISKNIEIKITSIGNLDKAKGLRTILKMASNQKGKATMSLTNLPPLWVSVNQYQGQTDVTGDRMLQIRIQHR